jgi:hypothetical protein
MQIGGIGLIEQGNNVGEAAARGQPVSRCIRRRCESATRPRISRVPAREDRSQVLGQG